MAGELTTDNAAIVQNMLSRKYAMAVNLSDYASDAGCDSSIFDGLGGSFGGCGDFNLFGSGMYGMTQADMINRQGKTSAELAKEDLNNQKEYQEELEKKKFELNAPEMAISNAIGNLKRHIDNNDQDKISDSYKKLTDAIKARYGYGKEGAEMPAAMESQIKAEAQSRYEALTSKNLVEHLEEKGDSSFTRGFKNGLLGIGWLFTDKTTTEENLEEITGETASANAHKAHTAAQWAGTAVAGIISVPALILAPAVAILGTIGLAKGGSKAIAGTCRGVWNMLFKSKAAATVAKAV